MVSKEDKSFFQKMLQRVSTFVLQEEVDCIFHYVDLVRI